MGPEKRQQRPALIAGARRIDRKAAGILKRDVRRRQRSPRDIVLRDMKDIEKRVQCELLEQGEGEQDERAENHDLVRGPDIVHRLAKHEEDNGDDQVAGCLRVEARGRLIHVADERQHDGAENDQCQDRQMRAVQIAQTGKGGHADQEPFGCHHDARRCRKSPCVHEAQDRVEDDRAEHDRARKPGRNRSFRGGGRCRICEVSAYQVRPACFRMLRRRVA